MIRAASLALVLLVLGLGVPALAQSGSSPQWVTGKVASIYEDRDGAVMSIEMADGEPYNVSVTRDMIKDVSVGDMVTVEIYKGWAEMIESVGAKPQAKPEPDKKKTGPQWVAGTLVSIDEGSENSLLSIKLSNDKIFNVSAANEMITGIKSGDYITVKILKGWAQKVTKK